MKISLIDKIAILLFFFLLTVATLCFGIKSRQDNENSSVCTLISLAAKTTGTQNNVNWEITSLSDNYFFILEKSTDNKKFTPVFMKKGCSSLLDHTLLYSFSESRQKTNEDIYYKLCVYKSVTNGLVDQLSLDKNFLEKDQKAIFKLDHQN